MGFGFRWEFGSRRGLCYRRELGLSPWFGFECGLGSLHQTEETGFVVQRDIGQHFPVQVETGGLQSADKLAVGNACRPARCVNAHDPQGAVFALLELASDVGELEAALYRFLRGAIELALGEEVTGGLL